MFNAGIDFGSTLVKAYWPNGHFMTAGTPEQLREMARRMRASGVRRVRRTGIGKVEDAFLEAADGQFEFVGAAEGAVDDEIRLQGLGVRMLMGRNADVPKKLIVAAVGTGVSYAKAKGKKIKRYPIGNCHGGGTILGLGRLFGAESFADLEEGARNARPCDLLVRDQLPAYAGQDIGEMVIAHFAKEDASYEERCASVFSLAAASIAKDLAVLTAIPFSPKDIVLVGRVAASPVFRKAIRRWEKFLKGRRLHFPEQGEYAAAFGAWADISK